MRSTDLCSRFMEKLQYMIRKLHDSGHRYNTTPSKLEIHESSLDFDCTSAGCGYEDHESRLRITTPGVASTSPMR